MVMCIVPACVIHHAAEAEVRCCVMTHAVANSDELHVVSEKGKVEVMHSLPQMSAWANSFQVAAVGVLGVEISNNKEREVGRTSCSGP